MKKTIVLMFLLAICNLSADAQIFNSQKKRAERRAKQRAKNKAQNKVDRKVDEAVDDAFNEIGNLFKKKKKKKAETEGDYENEDQSDYENEDDARGGLASMIMGGKSASELGLPDMYAFETYIKTKLTSTNKRGKESTSDFIYLLPKEGEYMGYEVEKQAIGVMDMEAKKIVTVIEDQNMATVMDMETIVEIASDYQEETTQADVNDIKITKTGKTKMIAGYKCEQYLIENDETEGEMWKALDFNEIDLMKMGSGMAQMMQQNKKLKVPKDYLEFMESGFMFEGTFLDKKNQEKTHMLVVSVEAKRTEVDLQKYQIMDMSRFMKKQ